MNISALFIRRPVMTTLVMLAILLFGIVAYRALPVSDLPNVDFPTISVYANLPGASPETMAASVATPLERQFSTINGVSTMSSSSTTGSTQITLQFDLSRNINSAAQDVQSAIAAASYQLPPNMPTPPTYRKVNPAASPILFLALTSPTMRLSDLDEYAETTVAQRISMVSGVAQVSVFGAQKYAVRIELNPQKLAAHQIGIDQVVSAVQNWNVNLPTGTLYGRNHSYTVQANGQLRDAAAFRPLIVAYKNGAPVRLGSLGRVLDSVANDKTASWFDQSRSIALAVDRQPGTNTVAVVDAIRRLLPTFRAQMPAAVQLRILHDHSTSIRASVNDVTRTLLLTVFLVILVIFLFLRNVSATIIPSLALPFSLVGTFAVMYELGYSLDNLSLLALTLSVGFVVDDAIVMLENIVRHLEMGKSVLQASLDGSREIAFTILSMTLSLTAVFIPVLFMGGILGRLLHEFAVTIASAILVSGFVSLTLTPMLASRFLRSAAETRHGRLYRVSERAFDGLRRAYEWSLQGALRHGRIVMVGTAAIIAATAWMFTIVPKGFVPSEDQGLIMGATQGPEGIAFKAMEARQQEAADIIRHDPNVAHYMSNVNDDGSGFLFLQLKPRSERPLSASQIIQELRPKFAQIPGLRVFLRNPPPINIGGHLSNSEYQFTLQSPDTGLLYREAPRFLRRLRALPELEDATSDLQMRKPQVNVEVDRNEAAALGVTAAQIETALFTAYGSRQVSMIYASNDEYQVIMQLEPKYQSTPSALQQLYIRSSAGQLVPLASVARLTTTTGPLSINHVGQLPAVTLSFNLAPGVSLGTALAAVEHAAREDLPTGITTSFQGTAQAFQSSLTGLGILLILAVLVIYIVLGILYESFTQPLTILSGLPAAGFGALLTLLLFHTDLDLYSFVGVIMLVGLVKKNGIMMIDFALDAQRRENKPALDAIYEGAVIRFRPIMMTTAAALMATIPIAFGTGAGAESRRPLGLAVVGGLLFSQFLTLYITPVVYVYVDAFQQFLRRRRPARRPAPLAEPEAVPGPGPAFGHSDAMGHRAMHHEG